MNNLKLKNGDSYIIREGLVGDAGNLLAFASQVFTETDFLTYEPGEFNMSLEGEEKFLKSIIDSDNQLYILAEHEEKVIGTLHFAAGNKIRTKHYGQFGVSVIKEYWSNGIGTELIKYLLSWVKNSQVVKKINLQVLAGNIKAVKLYLSLGFVVEGKILKNTCINGQYLDTYIMGLEV